MNTATDSLVYLAGAIASGAIRVVDLIAQPNASTPVIFALSKPFALEEIPHYAERGPAWYWNNFSCGEHTGTHLGAPNHWVTR